MASLRKFAVPSELVINGRITWKTEEGRGDSGLVWMPNIPEDLESDQVRSDQSLSRVRLFATP